MLQFFSSSDFIYGQQNTSFHFIDGFSVSSWRFVIRSNCLRLSDCFKCMCLCVCVCCCCAHMFIETHLKTFVFNKNFVDVDETIHQSTNVWINKIRTMNHKVSSEIAKKGVIMNNDSHKTEERWVKKRQPQLKPEETCQWNEINKRPTHTHHPLW